MAYVGFDLDETLGRFSAAHYASLFLRPTEAIFESAYSGFYGSVKIPEPPMSDNLRTKLKKGFDLFVDCLVEKEKESPPLGLIRPVMIPIVKKLYELKQRGEVKAVVIYSNNGNLALLHLAAQMLEKLADAPGLFSNFIHWYHPTREREVSYRRPGEAIKTLDTLVKAFGETTEIKDKLYFFDDLSPPHPILKKALQERYFQIAPYRYDADPAIVLECFKTAFEAAGLDTDPEYYTYMKSVLGADASYEKILKLMEGDRKIYRVRRNNKPNNISLKNAFNKTFSNKKEFSKALATVRRLERKMNEGLNLTQNEKNLYNKSQQILTVMEGGKQKTRKSYRSSSPSRRPHK